MLQPDFILIGKLDERAGAMLTAIHRTCCDNDPQVRRMNFINAELCKISINTYLDDKDFLCQHARRVVRPFAGRRRRSGAEEVGSDTRVGPKYLKGATGYGGPCFPRDNKALPPWGAGSALDVIWLTRLIR